jgi:Domain of unknown function (DUF3806)
MPSSEYPLESSALARQEQFLTGRSVADRSREVHEDASGSAVALVATVDSYHESVEPLSPEDEDGFARNAEIAVTFAEQFGGRTSTAAMSPADLDHAFADWLEAADNLGYTAEATVAVLGSAFGSYCVETLRMGWAQVREGESASFAVVANGCDVRAYPFDMIAKRLQTRETGFFASVYLVLKNRIAEANLRGDA